MSGIARYSTMVLSRDVPSTHHERLIRRLAALETRIREPSRRTGVEHKMRLDFRNEIDSNEDKNIVPMPHEYHRTKGRVAKVVDGDVAERPRSRGTRRSHDFDQDFELYSIPSQEETWVDPRDFSRPSSSVQACAPTSYGEQGRSRRSSWSLVPPPWDVEPCNSDFDSFGSWVQPDSVMGENWRNKQSAHQNFPVVDLMLPPATPQPHRLPSPDLQPMATDYEFCACCEDQDAKINEFWYLAGKARVDAQGE